MATFEKQMVRIGTSDTYISFTPGELKSTINHWFKMDDAHKRLTEALHLDEPIEHAVVGPYGCSGCAVKATRLLEAMAYDVKGVKVRTTRLRPYPKPGSRAEVLYKAGAAEENWRAEERTEAEE